MLPVLPFVAVLLIFTGTKTGSMEALLLSVVMMQEFVVALMVFVVAMSFFMVATTRFMMRMPPYLR